MPRRDSTPTWIRTRRPRHAIDAGAVLYATTGGFNDAVLVAPPLTISPHEVDLLVAAIDRALDSAERNLGPV